MKFAAHCAVSMIQNTNRAITADDIKRILYAWTLIIYPNPSESLYRNSKRYIVEWDLLFVLGTGDDMCKVMWSARGTLGYSKKNVLDGSYNVQSTVGSALSGASSSIFSNMTAKHPGRIKTEIASTILHPNLHIKTEEKKMILEIRYWNSDLRPWEWLGFWVLIPSYTPKIQSGVKGAFLTTVVIFTPKPELFSESAPTN
jgi:hypothetical protein